MQVTLARSTIRVGVNLYLYMSSTRKGVQDSTVPPTISSSKEEVRWVDPDAWGRLCWAILYPCSERKSDAWIKLMRLLPRILLCYSCRNCCSKFIQRFPPEEATNAQQWLSSLRRDIEQRNLTAPEANRLDKALSSRQRRVGDDSDRFWIRYRNFPQLWYQDVFTFLGLACLTTDFQCDKDKEAIIEFTTLISALLKRPLGLDVKSLAATATSDYGVQWVLASPYCDTPTVQALLAQYEIKVRQIVGSS
jgi:hypothetical protein